MALTYLEEQRKKQQAQPAQQSGLSGVSQNTQAQLQRYQQGYQPSQQVQQAQQQMNAVQQQKPQTYNSKYSAALDNILQTIQNPGSFKYEFNNDGLFRSYADLFTQQAKQAQANAQGNAAALTGGYGNSYGAAAGAQAYQQAILPLYDRGMELAQFARDNYDKDRQAPYDQLNALQSMDERDYGRYQDQLADWRTDQGIAREDYQTERTFDNDAYNRALDYWTGQAQAENADMRADQDENFRNAQLAEQIRSTDLDEQYRRDAMDYDQAADARNFAQSQYEFEQNSKLDWANLEEKQREYDASLSADEKAQNQKYAVAWVTDILANGQIPSMELLIAAGLSYEDAQKLVAQVQVGGGPGKTGDDEDGGNTEKPMSFLEANQLIFRNTPDNYALGDMLGYKGDNADKTFGEYKEAIQKAVAEREAKNTPTTEDKIKNATVTGGAAASALAAKQAAAKTLPTQAEWNKWLKKKGM